MFAPGFEELFGVALPMKLHPILQVRRVGAVSGTPYHTKLATKGLCSEI
jgi:hypothetical protein